MEPARRHRVAWLAAAALAFSGLWLASRPQDASAPPTFTQEQVPCSSDSDVPTAARREPDAGLLDAELTDSSTQAGRAFSSDAGTEAERVTKRWREALEPLFKSRRGSAKVEAKVVSVSADPQPEQVPDAGAYGSCRGRLLTLPLWSEGAVDILVPIDTSGSMFPELKEVVSWLTALELSLRSGGLDFQLAVVADRGAFQRVRTPLALDGGLVQAAIGSQDAFETLIRNARTGDGVRWPQLLRPGATKHLVIVTDDEAADPSGLLYLPRLLEAADGALGTPEHPEIAVHFLGGFEAAAGAVLQPSARLADHRCRPGGVAPGLAYQRVAQATGGLRASLCSPEAMAALGTALADWAVPRRASSCLRLLSLEADERVVEVRASALSRGVLRLHEAHNAEACVARKDGWLRSGRLLALCQSTCEALRESGFAALEVHTECRP